MTTSEGSTDTIDIAELAARLERTPNTLRQWMRRTDFPRACVPAKLGGRGKLVWSPDQVELLLPYAEQRSAARGWAGYHQSQGHSSST